MVAVYYRAVTFYYIMTKHITVQMVDADTGELFVINRRFTYSDLEPSKLIEFMAKWCCCFERGLHQKNLQISFTSADFVPPVQKDIF